jgi:hypothetical protein
MFGYVTTEWYCWWFRGSGSSGFTKAHVIVTRKDGKLIKLCDRHVLTVAQLRSLQMTAPKGICKVCNRKLYADSYGARKASLK